MSFLKTFTGHDDGTTAVEYAVLLALIVLTCVIAISAFGSATGGLWSNSTAQLEAAGF